MGAKHLQTISKTDDHCHRVEAGRSTMILTGDEAIRSQRGETCGDARAGTRLIDGSHAWHGHVHGRFNRTRSP
jgi:hypothetical protein